MKNYLNECFECNTQVCLYHVKFRFKNYFIYRRIHLFMKLDDCLMDFDSNSFKVQISNYSLLIRSVSKVHHGKYQCFAVNSEGEESQVNSF